MTATFILQRHEDPSGVSGTGDVAWGAEFPDGAVAIRWPGDHPSTATWDDIRGPEAIHGHGGKTVVRYEDNARLLRAYQRVVSWLLSARYHDRPITCAPHPDHPDRLRCTFRDERTWAFWVALLDGSTHAASHEEVNGELRHCWITPDGDIWLEWYSRLPNDDNPLDTFDREDR